jgi:site-specific DNA recombinase
LLNEAGYKSKTGRPFSKETVRDLLQNHTYLGKVKYQKFRTHSDGTRSFEEPVEWFEGQHEAVIDTELFERCQQVRAKWCSHRQATPKYNSYLLRNLIYCYRCCSNPPEDKTFRQYGKMRPDKVRIPVKTITRSGPWRSHEPEQSDQSQGDNTG